MKNTYLKRYAYPRQYLQHDPAEDTRLVVVLPAYNEPALLDSLEALRRCACPCPTLVIVVINASETAADEVKAFHEKTYEAALKRFGQTSAKGMTFTFILENELPHKHAGVGLARKIGMDEAVRVLEAVNQPDGVILCFDADCDCAPDLLQRVMAYFDAHPKSPGCSVYFEHPLEGSEPDEVYRGIAFYELHLRYYVDALRYAGFPYAYQTIGSSMAVRSSAYQKQGGMNRRKAGEDFYFLHKIIPLGHFGEVNSTAVYPSPRVSNRVPFGTGRAVGDWLQGNKPIHETYHYETFIELKVFLDRVERLFDMSPQDVKGELKKMPEAIRTFLVDRGFEEKLKEVAGQSRTLAAFRKRFFQWFDGFLVLKYVHYARDHFYPNIATEVAVDWLFDQYGILSDKEINRKLLALRAWDRQSLFVAK